MAYCFTNENLGGVSGTPRGNLYGSNLYALLQTGATFISNLTACEINVENQTGTSAAYISGIQIADRKNNRGSDTDAALSISSALGVGWTNGILFSAANGSHPVDTSSTLLKTSGSASALSGIDISSYTFSSYAFRSNAFNVDGSGNAIFGTSVARVADTFAPIQADAQSGQERGLMVNKAGAYGAWFGFRNNISGETCGMIRMITNDPFRIYVGNTLQAVSIVSSGDATFTQSLKSNHASAGIGYATGAGGTVTQLTDKTTGVTINKVCGQITLNNAALAAGTSVSFTITNSAIEASDFPNVIIASGATAGSYFVGVDAVDAGSCRVHLRNISAGSLSEALVLNFILHKAVAA